jgi:hypothetical protein
MGGRERGNECLNETASHVIVEVNAEGASIDDADHERQFSSGMSIYGVEGTRFVP